MQMANVANPKYRRYADSSEKQKKKKRKKLPNKENLEKNGFKSRNNCVYIHARKHVTETNVNEQWNGPCVAEISTRQTRETRDC